MGSALRGLVAATLFAGCASPSGPPRGDAPAASTAEPTAATRAPGAEDPGSECPAGRRCDYGAFASRPPITQILIEKRAHRLHLLAGELVVRTYGVALGSGGMSQKAYEGDRVTPIGRYHVVGRYPSKWHTYLALDYPNDEDKKRHADLVARGEVPKGRGPGSAIAIHGRKSMQPDRVHKLVDWTLGCVALDNAEIDEVASVAPVGTEVVIVP